MKKLLMGIFGLTLLLPFGVFAEGGDITSVEEGSNSASQTITIGTVETPVYEVNMIWEDPIFNWIYNEETETYNWVASACVGTIPYEAESLLSQGKPVYSDNSCSTQITTEEYVEGESYYHYETRSHYFFHIEDMTRNGKIVPSVNWTSSDEYNYVEGKFYYNDVTPECRLISEENLTDIKEYFEEVKIYNDNSCENEVDKETITYEENKYYALFTLTEYKELLTDEIPTSAAQSGSGSGFYEEISNPHPGYYDLGLKLVNKEQPTTTPTAGDTLGTVTISIRAAE